jgi:hypothetical protein
MQHECEIGSRFRPGSNRVGVRADRQGSSLSTNVRLSLETVITAAVRRQAPISVETAGYIALAVADALVSASAVVRPCHVFITLEGEILLKGAQRGDDGTAETSVRSLLASLLSVAVGTSPALTASSRRTGRRGLTLLVEELEAALIPVNRAAARRAIGRLAREVQRSGIQSTPRLTHGRPSQRSARDVSKESRVSPACAVDDPGKITVQVDDPLSEITEVDAPVGPVAPAFTELSTAEPTAPNDSAASEEESTPAAPPPLNEAQYSVDTLFCGSTTELSEPPELTAPSVSAAFDEALSPGVDELPDERPEILEASSNEAWELEGSYDDLQTYEPPEAVGDESLDFGTASPPQVEPIALEEPSIEEISDLEVPAPQAPCASSGLCTSGSDRVHELLEEFRTPERASREWAGELKEMLGLPPTPPPPVACQEAGESAADSEPSTEQEPPPPLTFRPPRHPRLGIALTMVLLVLAIAVLLTCYVLHPALLMGG